MGGSMNLQVITPSHKLDPNIDRRPATELLVLLGTEDVEMEKSNPHPEGWAMPRQATKAIY